MLGWLDEVSAQERIPFPPRAERPRRGRRPGAASVSAEPSDAIDAVQPADA